MSFNSGVENLSASFQDERDRRRIVVYDCRGDTRETTGRILDTTGLDFEDFLQVLLKEFSIPSIETFVLTTTDREVLDSSKFEELHDGNTLHLMQNEDQILPASTKEHIVFLPHYDTLVRSGMYEYYASEGQNSLPYAFAELIDNALSATSKNTGARTIEIRLLFDETLGKPAVIAMDNGIGMTSKQLNNWAVYRLSKYSRENYKFGSDRDGYVRPDPVPRSLNSDISYFGVGGKQAAFYIGDSVRMITKPKDFPDVHELILSKEEFERKEKNKEDIYCSFIRNRQVGDSSHVEDEDERFLRGLIAEEFEKESFTAVVVTGVQPEHITFLKRDFHLWTRELAHIYHYYIHGVDGNTKTSAHENSGLPSIDIEMSLREKPPRCPRVVNLREIDNDMQTLYLNSAADMFEFKACVSGDAIVEGVLRYHPFLYDRETYPSDPFAIKEPVDDDEDESVVTNQARGKRPIFECFWNGRLIPYTTVAQFDWCAKPKKGATLPAECYSRFSGVLFTNDKFQVSTNKLTFMDLELQLMNKDTIFTRIVKGQEQRVKIQKEFTQWLKSCHEKWDKQVRFIGYERTISRTDVATKKMQHPWATFSSIEWDGKKYKTGQYVKSQKTQPIFCGSVVQFLLYGDHDGDVYATGGQVKVALEPKALYDEVKTIPISKIDKSISIATIKRSIEDELAKLPDKLNVKWPEENAWAQNDVHPAGTPLGPLHVEILNKKGESISRLPSAVLGTTKKLLIELKVVWHGPNGDQETNSHIAQFSAKWSYWFKTMENLSKLGQHTLTLSTVLNESNATIFAGKPLPSYTLKFTIAEGNAVRFSVGALSSPLHVGVPFDIPLMFVDAHEYPARPPEDLKPVLECSGLNVSYKEAVVSGTEFTIRGVKACGRVENYQCKTHDLKVVFPGHRLDAQTVRISLLPGNPHCLQVKPEDDPITVENGDAVSFNVEVHDEAGNITAHPKLIVRCKVQELPLGAIDCSSTGAGRLVTEPIKLENMNGEEKTIEVKFDVPSKAAIQAVVRELRVVPSRCVAQLEIYSQDDEDITVLKNKEKVEWEAGDTLENLCYRLYDEGGREVPLSEEVARRIKVSWTANLLVQDLAVGKLPSVHVPTLVEDVHFYQVFYQDQRGTIDTSFTVVPRPSETESLKATLSDCIMRMGEALPGKIYLELNDQYGNITKMFTSTCVDEITVEGEGLDKSGLAFTWQESSHSVVVSGVRLQPGTPGIRELSFKWKNFVEHVRIKITAGTPALLTLIEGPEQPLQVLNEQGIPSPFVLQLCDKWGNPSPDQKVVVELKASSSSLKLISAATSQPVDAEGKVVFFVDGVAGPKGDHELTFQGIFNKKPIQALSVKLTVIPDPHKPVELAVTYDTNATFPAGGTLPVFSVTVVSEEGSPIRNVNPAALSMLLWKGEATGSRPPKGATQLKCSKPMDAEKVDQLHFREKVIPEQAGQYTIQFALRNDKNTSLWSTQYGINVKANNPVRLAPECKIPTPVISNSDALPNRTLVKDMTLLIMDAFGNPAGSGLSGKVVVTVKRSNGGGDEDLPRFHVKTTSLHFKLQQGKAHISSLAIMANSPGQDGTEYIMHFKPEVQGGVPKDPLMPFELPFRFYNDAENQRQMSELSKKKDELTTAIAVYKEIFDTYSELLNLLTTQHQDANNKVVHLKAELQKINLNAAQLTTIPAIDSILAVKAAEADGIKSQPRRVCGISDPFRGSQDVVGKVGHLALVADDDAAVVISWHVFSDMDCVVTKTTAAAQRIYSTTQGRQQVMPLDGVFWKPTNRPLPHIRNGHNVFNPTGNPVFVKDLLIYPQDEESCKMVFGNLLGETILIDDLDSATNYRKAVVQSKAPCPTILTRQGDRVNARGKFGGAQNKALSIEKLHGHVFGAPFPKQYHVLQGQIELLQHYRSAVQKSQHAKSQLDDHMQKLKAPDMVRKEEEREEKIRQLEEIQQKLVSTPVRTPAKRRLQDASELLSTTKKKTKKQST